MNARPTDQMRNIAPFGLRMQPDLKARVQEAADANGRSMNSEIVARLESTFPRIAIEPHLPERLGENVEDVVARHVDLMRSAMDATMRAYSARMYAELEAYGLKPGDLDESSQRLSDLGKKEKADD